MKSQLGEVQSLTGKVKYGLLVTLLAAWLSATIMASSSTPSSPWVYLAFSSVYLLLLITAIFQRQSLNYSFLYISIFLWLGFWFKFTIHVLLDYPFVESIGNFYGPDKPWYRATWIAPVSYSRGEVLEWNGVLWSATVGALGVLLAWYLHRYLFEKYTAGKHLNVTPPWYSAARVWLWGVLIFVIVSAAILNALLGVQKAGMIPRTILPWPLNAVIAWVVSIGGAIAVSTLMYWDLESGRKIRFPILMVLVEAFLSTLSLMSRAVYIFHVLPQLIGALKFRKQIVTSRLGEMGLAAVVIGLFVAAIMGVTSLREQEYESISAGASPLSTAKISIQSLNHQSSNPPVVPTGQNVTNVELSPRAIILDEAISEIKSMIKSGKPMQSQLEKLLDEQKLLALAQSQTPMAPTCQVTACLLDQFRATFGVIIRLAADRWIGIEGVMAVQTNSDNSVAMLTSALIEKREIGKLAAYQKLSNSLYADMDPTKNQFASLPGPIAFFLLGGSLWMVVAGMLALTTFALSFEAAISTLTGNPILCALIGLALGNCAAQFGLAPRQDIPFFLMIMSSAVLISFLQSGAFASAVARLHTKFTQLS